MVRDVLEKFTSKVGQFVEIMDLEEFGHALFIDHEIQVAEKDEKIYSSNFFKSSYDLSKKNNNVAIIGGGDGGVRPGGEVRRQHSGASFLPASAAASAASV